MEIENSADALLGIRDEEPSVQIDWKRRHFVSARTLEGGGGGGGGREKAGKGGRRERGRGGGGGGGWGRGR